MLLTLSTAIEEAEGTAARTIVSLGGSVRIDCIDLIRFGHFVNREIEFPLDKARLLRDLRRQRSWQVDAPERHFCSVLRSA